jgi:broad specificity phosphatase PhoE
MDKITHILCSPLERSLQTALEGFKPLLERGLVIVAWDKIIEIGPGPCNVGDSLPRLKKKMEGLPAYRALGIQYLRAC